MKPPIAFVVALLVSLTIPSVILTTAAAAATTSATLYAAAPAVRCRDPDGEDTADDSNDVRPACRSPCAPHGDPRTKWIKWPSNIHIRSPCSC